MTRFQSLGTKKTPSRIVILPDTHAPYEDKRAWDAAMHFCRRFKPDTLIHLGDLADFYCISEHDKDPRRSSNLLVECKTTNALLDEMDSLGAERKIFCAGNHENRLERTLMKHAPGLMGAISIDSLLGFSRRGWHIEAYQELVKVGKLFVTHDVGYCGASAVRQAAVACGHSIVTGHGHRLESLYFSKTTGESHVSAMAGHLADINEARYCSPARRAAWHHGLISCVMVEGGDFQLNLVPIVDGRLVV